MNILSTISDIFPGFLLSLRWQAFRNGIFYRKNLPYPVISVGSIILGGAGKTPTVEYIAKILLSQGRKPAILARGYGRSTKDYIVLRNGDGRWQSCGDEPMLLSKMLPSVPIVVHHNRYKAGMALADEADTYILDDGFQHLQLQRNLDVIMLTGKEHNIGLFPFGTRRDGLWRLKNLGDNNRAIAILPQEIDSEGIGKILPENIKIFHRKTIVDGIHPVGDFEKMLPSSRVAGKKVFIASGIARPDRFFDTVKSLGAIVVGKLFFRDHHFYKINQIGAVISEAEKSGANMVLTTQKDAVRIGEFEPPDTFAVAIRTEIVESEIFKTILREIVELS